MGEKSEELRGYQQHGIIISKHAFGINKTWEIMCSVRLKGTLVNRIEKTW